MGFTRQMGLPLALLAVTTHPSTHGPALLTREAEMCRGALELAVGAAAAVDLAAISIAVIVSAEFIAHAATFHVLTAVKEVKAPRNSLVPFVPKASRRVATTYLASSIGIIGRRVMPGRGKPITPCTAVVTLHPLIRSRADFPDFAHVMAAVALLKQVAKILAEFIRQVSLSAIVIPD